VLHNPHSRSQRLFAPNTRSYRPIRTNVRIAGFERPFARLSFPHARSHRLFGCRSAYQIVAWHVAGMSLPTIWHVTGMILLTSQ
jgi:hypothetical protein